MQQPQLQNTIVYEIGSQTPTPIPSPINKKQPLEEQFIELTQYPIPREAQRYPKPSSYIYSYQSPTQIHDIITTNLLSLVPNIDIGCQMEIPPEQLKTWIAKTKEYADSINQDFQKKCDIKLQKLLNIEEQRQQCQVLNMEYFNRLPEDIIKYIYSYLSPEVNIQLLKARYPNLANNLMKLKVPQIKQLTESIRINYYNKVIQTLYQKNRARCLPKGFFMRFGFHNKQYSIDTIYKLLGSYETAVAHTPSDYRYFQKKSLKIIKTLIYVARTKKVLDKPYAPELEQQKAVLVTAPSIKQPTKEKHLLLIHKYNKKYKNNNKIN
jgi:hypothetical protein